MRLKFALFAALALLLARPGYCACDSTIAAKAQFTNSGDAIRVCNGGTMEINSGGTFSSAGTNSFTSALAVSGYFTVGTSTLSVQQTKVGVGIATPVYGFDAIHASGIRLSTSSTSGYLGLLVYTDNTVGIGTATPSNKLHVHGTAAGKAGIYLNDAAPGTTTATLYNSGGSLYWAGSAIQAGSSISGTANYVGKFTAGTTIGNSAMYDSSGSIGIGTTVPANKLHVHGTGAGAAGVYLNDAVPGTATATLYNSGGVLYWASAAVASGAGTSGKIAKFTGANAVGDSVMTELDSKIGIGSTSPSVELDVVGQAAISSTATAKNIILNGTNNGAAGMYINDATPASTANALYSAASTLYWNGSAIAPSNITGTTGTLIKFTGAAAGGDSIVVESSGEIGINQASPDGVLHVNKNEAGATDYLLKLSSGTDVRVVVYGDGKVGVGSTAPSVALDVVGAGAFTGALSGTTLNTGQGANELYGMDQAVLTTSAVGFASAAITYGVTAATMAINTDDLVLNADGFVGIGKTNPATALDVVGTVTATAFAGGGANVTGLVAGNITAGGTLPQLDGSALTNVSPKTLTSKTEAQLWLIDPISAGEIYYCTDCSSTVIVISTGAAVGDIAGFAITAME